MGNKINLMEEDAELRNSIYGKSRDGVNIMFNVKKSTQPVNAGQRMRIIVPGQGFDGEDGVDIHIVSKAYIRMDGDQVITDYELIQESHEFYPVSHSTLEGKSIEATVMEVVSEDGIAKMKVDLSVGLMKAADSCKSEGYEDEYKGGFNFPYMTAFSQGNSGFFCTPDAGDRVMLTFNSRNESHAYVLQGAVNSSGNDRFNNRDNRTFSSSPSGTGQPMFNLTLSSEVFSVDVTDHIGLTAANSVNATATGGHVEVAGGSSVNLSSKSSRVNIDNSDIQLNSSGNLNVTSSNVTITGVSKAEVVGGDVDVN